MNKTIYTFWLGDEKRRNELIEYHKHINKIIYPWKIELGPTKDEHDFLMKNSNFYKKSYKKKIYAFCSDIYRAYIIYKSGGLYVDSGFTFNEEKIQYFLNDLIKYDYFFIWETNEYFLNGIFWCKKNSEFFLKRYIKFMNFQSFFSYNFLITSPIILTNAIYKTYKDEYFNKNWLLKECDFLDNRNKNNIFFLNSTGSWHIENKNPTLYKKKVMESWYYKFDNVKKWNNKKINILKNSYFLLRLKKYNVFLKKIIKKILNL